MKKAMVLAVGLTLVAAIANGAAVQFYDLGTSSVGQTVSSDGKYIAGSAIDSGVVAYRFPAYWSADLAGGTAPVRNNLTAYAASGYVGGISSGTDGTVYTAVNIGGTTYTSGEFTPRVGTPAGVSYLLDPDGASSNSLVAGNNAAEFAADGSGVYVAGTWTSGGYSRGNPGIVWKYDGTTASLRPVGAPALTGKVTLRAVNSVGTAVGGDRGGVAYNGGTGKDRAVYATMANPNVAIPVPVFANNSTTTSGNAYDVAGDYVAGLMYRPFDANYKGFIWKMGDANATQLNMVPGAVSGTVAVAYAVASDGAAVGMSYIDDSNMPGGLALNHDTGTIWFPGETAGRRVIDVLVNQGIYSSSIRTIGRTYSIASLGGGQYALSGEGTFWTDAGHTTSETRAWFAVVPEPATALFVAFGGLALLRRRR